MATSADAVAREAVWLTTSGDGLPTLLTTAGGPWDIVQGYTPRTPPTRQTAIYLTRTSTVGVRRSNQRRIETYDFRARLHWPIGSATTGSNLWEAEQAAFDSAIQLLTQRIYGFLGDHTHGGRFLSAAETPDPARVMTRFDDPEVTANQSPAILSATITYTVDDFEIII
jgi:hypothetical protein